MTLLPYTHTKTTTLIPMIPLTLITMKLLMLIVMMHPRLIVMMFLTPIATITLPIRTRTPILAQVMVIVITAVSRYFLRHARGIGPLNTTWIS